MPHLDKDQMDELLSGEHGVIALQAARELQVCVGEINGLRQHCDQLQNTWDQENKRLRDENSKLFEQNVELSDQMKAMQDKYAVLVDIRKDLGLDKPNE